MARIPKVELANSLQRVKDASRKDVVRSSDMKRGDRERLLEKGYLKVIIKGWYFLYQPTNSAGDGTGWAAQFWDFLSLYLNDRFGEGYCLSAGSSFDVHVGVNVNPSTVTVITGSGGKTLLELPSKTSLLTYTDKKNLPDRVEVKNGLRVMSLPEALCRIPATLYTIRPSDLEIALSLASQSELIGILLEGPYLTVAERLAGAYEVLGNQKLAEEIVTAVVAAGYTCKPVNPFEPDMTPLLQKVRPVSPYAARIEQMYRSMREDVLAVLSSRPVEARANSSRSYLENADEVYTHDAYNSLSIEGYQVTPDLIEKIRDGGWDPEHDPADREEANALAAKGYFEAFNAVKISVAKIVEGDAAAGVIEVDFSTWYRELFSASVQAGILPAERLAGYRRDRVFIKGATYVPPPHTAVTDSVEMLFRLLAQEDNVFVQGVLGHFLFVYIHPYMDGNGRIARFLMNAFFASEPLPWSIIRVENRKGYMIALEQASVEKDITIFAQFVRDEMDVDWSHD